MRRIALGALLIACGGSEPRSVAEPDEPGHTDYSLHEWGLLTVNTEVVELAAGPGTQAPPPDMGIVVEKPVVYVHAGAPVRFALRVRPGAGYALAERWPGSEAPILWEVTASGAPCGSAPQYPDTCTSVDGYCEVRELARYEAADASCLEVGPDRTSMLFYRLRAEPNVAARLPVQIESGRARASATRTAWRVKHDGRAVRTWRVELSGEATAFPESAAQGAPAAAAWMHHELERRGLTNAEREAFERAWWPTLFGGEMVQEPSEVVEEARVEEDLGIERTDMLLYFLEDAEIAAIARLDATPAPTTTRRAFVVRQLL